MKSRRFSLALGLLAIALLLMSTGMAAAQGPLTPAGEQAQGASAADVVTGGGGPGPIGTGFTYQGQLKSSGGAVNGACDFIFSLWDSSGSGAPPTGGIQIGATDNELGVTVTNGLFSAVINFTNQFGVDAFKEARWLQISVRCPAGSGGYTVLSPRQPLWAAPYALGLRPGTRILGSEYQNLKVQSEAPTGSIPAAVTGEMISALDGVGVYGSNNTNAAGSAGAGVWGRTWNLAGAGVKGTALNGSDGVVGVATGGGIGVKATGDGIGMNNPAVWAENTNAGASTPAGIAIMALNHSADAAIVARNTFGGDAYRAVNAAGNAVNFRVTTTGRVVTSAVEVYGGGDLAENFASEGGAPEPGTLMVIDAEHPGKLKPSGEAYDTRVAGIVSGAGGVNPGVTLQQEGVMDGDTPIAVAGRVYVKAEALSAPIEAGDLLTTSDLSGYAMKAVNRGRSQGAVIGKAMTELAEGKGLVLVLVSLQ